MKDDRSNIDKSKPEDSIFCTACGEKLEDFCFSLQVKDVEAIKKRLDNCKKTGKFSGGTCAMLFIASPDNPP
ncbi:MAG TPA: hypothetical protein VKI62_00130 [Bacteroidota bacterium]|nr:hypothetical protein [Bacteroidota bacterium]